MKYSILILVSLFFVSVKSADVKESAEVTYPTWNHAELANLQVNYCCSHPIQQIEIIKQKNEFIHREIHQKGYSINDKDSKGKTLFMKSFNWFKNNTDFNINNNHELACACLFVWASDPNIQDNEGKTALMYALENGFYKFIENAVKKIKANLLLGSKSLLQLAKEKLEQEGDLQDIVEKDKYNLSDLVEFLSDFQRSEFAKELVKRAKKKVLFQDGNDSIEADIFVPIKVEEKPKRSWQYEMTEYEKAIFTPPLKYPNDIHNLIAEYVKPE